MCFASAPTKVQWELIWELFGNYGFSMPLVRRHPKQLWSMSGPGEEGYSATGGAKASSRTADLLPHEPNQKETARPINRSSPACGDYLRCRFYYDSCAGFSDTCTQTDVISDGRRKYYCYTCSRKVLASCL